MAFDPVTLGMAKAAAGVKVRKGAFSFGTTSASTTTTISDWHQRTAVRLPVATTRWRLHVRNADFRSGGAATAGAISCVGVWHGLSAKAADGSFNLGNFTAAPTNVLPAFTTAADGAEYVSGWVTAPASQMAPGRDYILAMGFTSASGQTVQRAIGAQSWFSSGTGASATANVSAQNLTLGSVSLGLLDIWVEYEFVGANPVVMFVGDSLTEGYLATYGQRDNYPNQWAQRHRAVAVVNAANGSGFAHFQNSFDTKWSKYTGIVPDAVVLCIGSNDLSAGTALATIQSGIGAVVTAIRATYGAGVPVHLCTIMPRAFTGTNETNRVALNTWLRKLPWGVNGCFSLEKLVQSPADVTGLDAEWSADGTHLTTGGYARMTDALAGFRPIP